MDWQEMHIGLDLGLQGLNSNLFNKLEKEGKDYLINKVISDIISETVSNGKQTVFNLESYDDIRKYNSLIEPLIKTINLLLTNSTDGRYVYGILPKEDKLITSGLLYSGRTYKVMVAGTTDLSTFGSTHPPVLYSTFTCTLGDVASNALVVGGIYTIKTKGNADFTTVGAINNMVGTTFVSTGSATGTTGSVSCLAHAPTWAGTTLQNIENYNIHEFISSYSNVDYGEIFGTGWLTEKETYRVVTGGTIANLTSLGSAYNTVEAGYQFTCTSTGLPIWATSGVKLIQTKSVLNRLVKFQDIENFLQHSYGTVTSSPISTFADGKLIVYHDKKFNINFLTLNYLIPPVKVDCINNVNCNLPESFHSMILDKTIQYAMSISGNPNYQAMLNENKDK